MSEIETATRFRTRDGDWHDTWEAALQRAAHLNNIDAANKSLAQGKSLAESLRITGVHWSKELAAVSDLYASSKLMISHWQCRDTPGYSPVRLTSDGCIFVWGDAGSWSGPYGADCSLRDVARYWEATKATRRAAEPARATNGEGDE